MSSVQEICECVEALFPEPAEKAVPILGLFHRSGRRRKGVNPAVPLGDEEPPAPVRRLRDGGRKSVKVGVILTLISHLNS